MFIELFALLRKPNGISELRNGESDHGVIEELNYYF